MTEDQPNRIMEDMLRGRSVDEAMRDDPGGLARAMVQQRIHDDPSIAAAPKLVHAGTYALYETPDGGRHLVYRRTQSVDEDGTLRDVDMPDAHLPDIPPEALPLIGAWLEHGFPPAVLAMLGGKLSPMTVLKAMRNGGGDAP